MKTYLENTQHKTGLFSRVAQVVEHLPSKFEALYLNPIPLVGSGVGGWQSCSLDCGKRERDQVCEYEWRVLGQNSTAKTGQTGSIKAPCLTQPV
jgi:hypothetical protein